MALITFVAQVIGLVYLLINCLHWFPGGGENFWLAISYSAVFILLPFIMYPEIISRFSWNVRLDDEKVWMKGDWIAAKWYRVQLPVEVNYSNIVSMDIEYSYNNSSGRSIRSWFYGTLWSKKRYLVFINDRGRKKRLHVSHYTDAALAKIIDEIAMRCEAKGDKYDGRRAAQILSKLQN